MTRPDPSTTALAFDYGRRRIGVASGNALTGSAAPLATVAHGEHEADWPAIERLVATYKPTVLVVGTPYNDDGTPGALAAEATRFAATLAQRCGLPVERVDEGWSSREASAELRTRRAAGTRRRKVQRADIDSLAAAIILERWLRGE